MREFQYEAEFFEKSQKLKLERIVINETFSAVFLSRSF